MDQNFDNISWTGVQSHATIARFVLKHNPENNLVGGIVDNSIDSWLLNKSGSGGFDEGTHETEFLIVWFFEEILNINVLHFGEEVDEFTLYSFLMPRIPLISISLNVVSIAQVFWASLSLWAILCLILVILTLRSSLDGPADPTAAGAG